jgi:tetratricopeptide (TPR) repeat protein
LAIARQTRSLPDEANALENTGVAWMREGNLANAQELFKKALSRFQDLGDRAGVGSVLNSLGETAYLRGELPEAERMLRQALEIDQAIDYPQDQADVLSWLGRIGMAQTHFADAQRWFDESIRISSGAGFQVFAAECRLAKTESWLDMDRPAEAEGVIHEAAEFFKNNSVFGLEVEARTILVRALLEEGKTAEAGRELDRAAVLHPENYGPETRYAFEIVQARVDAASGKDTDMRDAVARLKKTIDDAGRSGYLVYRLHAQLALGEIEWKQGQAKEGRRVLGKLGKEAHARGFEAIAGRAAAVSR